MVQWSFDGGRVGEVEWLNPKKGGVRCTNFEEAEKVEQGEKEWKTNEWMRIKLKIGISK